MPVYLLAAGFLAGVAASSFLSCGPAAILFALLFALASSLLALVLHARRRVFLYAALVLCAVALGMVRMDAAGHLRDPALDTAVGRQVAVEGIVADDADVRADSVLLTVAIDAIHDGAAGSTSRAAHARALVIAPAYTKAAYGDRVRVSGQLVLPAPFETDTGRSFDYPGYLAVSGIAYEVQDPTVQVAAEGMGNPVYALLFGLKHRYLAGLAAALPEPAAALAGGITVGDKRSLGDDLLDEFREAGVVHVVVLSGYNVTIIAEALLRVFAFLPLAFGLAASAASIALFALMTGGAASIARASIMAILALMAQALGRRYAITRALALAVVGMVAWNPFVLVHDPGFDLSVLATIGLVFVSPLIEARASWVTPRFGVRSVMAATLGTQAIVLPFLLYQSGMLSLVALPVNVLVLAAIPAAMLFSGIAALAGILLPVLAPFIGLPAYALLSYVLDIVAIAVALPHAALTIPQFPRWMMLVSYACMFAWLAIHATAMKKKTAGS